MVSLPKKSSKKKSPSSPAKSTDKKSKSARSTRRRRKKAGVEDVVLALLKIYGRAVSRRRLHELVYLLENKYGVDLGVKFYGNPPLSKELDETVDKLVEEGLVKTLYVVGENYLTLYKPYYKLSEKGLEAASKKLDKSLEEKLVKLVEEVKSSKVSAVVSESK